VLTATKEEAKKIESPLEGKEKINQAPQETKETLPPSEAREETEPQSGAAKEITQTPQNIGEEQQGEPRVVREEEKNLEFFPKHRVPSPARRRPTLLLSNHRQRWNKKRPRFLRTKRLQRVMQG
jgi:hypothetical protein